MSPHDVVEVVRFLVQTGTVAEVVREVACARPLTRDELAAMAMQGLLARGLNTVGPGESPSGVLAATAYRAADAMLAERAKVSP